jgi:Protein of unknown function (DUF3592)
MFDLVFSAFSALNQVAVFAGALCCWGLGALLVGNAIYWRLHALRVQGEVIGVRRNGNCLTSVYRYASPAGQTFEATSLEGSSSVRGRETGRLVPLWVMPDKPNEAQEAGNHLFTILGAALLGMGAVLFWFGATAWRTGPMTWIVGGVFLVHLLRKLRSIIAPRDKTLPPSGWRALPALLKAARTADAAPMQRMEDLAALPEYRDRQVKQQLQLARLAPFLLLAGVGLLAFGVHESRALLRLEASGIRTSGSVTGLSSSRSSDGGTTYQPLVSYQDRDGRTVVFRDSTGTNPPLYHVGERVGVLYLPGEPSRAIIDRGVWNWLPAAILYGLGAALLAAGLAAWRGRQSGEPLAAQS